MALMKFKRDVPPRGWSYIQPETRLKMTGESLPDLAAKVVAHRRHKSLSRVDVEEASIDIQRQICARLTKRECAAEGIEDEWVPIVDNVNIKLSHVVSISRAAIEWVQSGGELIPREELKERTSVCLACPLNNPMTGCKCSVFYKMIDKAIPADRRNPELGICGACSCALNAKINLPMNVIAESNRGRRLSFPVYCWQRGTE